MIRADEHTVDTWNLGDDDIIIYFSEAGNGMRVVDDILYDLQFKDENGNIYNLEEPVAHEQCKTHQFVMGEVSKHKKNSNGGCTVKIYEAKRCKVCGYAETGALISENNYNPCPH